MIKVGDVCIWQNLNGAMAYLNNSETTVLEPLMPRMGENVNTGERSTTLCYGTDTVIPGYVMGALAKPHHLRKKFPDADDEELMKDEENERDLASLCNHPERDVV